MKFLSGDQLRQAFIRFFTDRNHFELPSIPLVPRDDPSVLFVTAGMQQMIPYFLGEEQPVSKRLVSIQKCLRTVDIEEVGDPSHLTFFEMLGNFSVGDYFVPEALRFTWDFLVGELGLDPSRLWATVYPGDTFARDEWLKIGIIPTHLVEDPSNWWTRAGLAGPAGPDSEVHFDRGLRYGCGEPDCNPTCERCERFVEIWNNVFMQSFVNEKNEVQRELATKNIDTGQGFERILMVVQDKETVYETDVFAPVLESVARALHSRYGDDPAVDQSLRIIADHSRSLVMAMADGAFPGNEGRGYVLRRLLRRAVLRGRLLGLDKPFLAAPASEVIRIQSTRYPEVEHARDSILHNIRQEEERFADTLSRGLPMVEDLIEQGKASGNIVPGAAAFTLHDTFGLPLELIQEVSSERGLTVDVEGFERALKEQQARGRAGRPSGGRDLESLATLAEHISPTVFVGYTESESQSRVEGVIVGGQLVGEASEGDEVEVVLDRSPFYAESGGQVGDAGKIMGPAGAIEVRDTQRPYGGIFIHRGVVTAGTITPGDTVTARIDGVRRARIRPHHSATHLLHLALHEVLGPEATQAGSLVAADRLRFDFRWSVPVTPRQLSEIQERVNQLVFEDQPVTVKELDYPEAIAEGAMALFGEKYGERVRMVVMGPSKELCGGTHVAETLDIGPVVILSESGIGTGIRRIEAIAGRASYEHFLHVAHTLQEAAGVLGVPTGRVVERTRDVVDQLKETERRLSQARRRVLSTQAQELAGQSEPLDADTGSGRLVARAVSSDSRDDFIQLASATMGSLDSGVVIMGSVIEGKPQFAVAVSRDLEANGFSAKDIAQRVGKAVGGGAGGTAGFAQGGGKDAGQLDSGLKAAETFVRELAGSAHE